MGTKRHRRSMLLLAVLLAVAAAACSGGAASPSNSPSAPGTPDHLAGTAWTVLSVAGRTPISEIRPTVEFTVDRVQGTGGCNAYGGPYTYVPDSGTLTIGELVSTMMGCLGPRGEFEGVFFAAFGGQLQATVAGDQLHLEGAKGELVLLATAPGANGG